MTSPNPVRGSQDHDETSRVIPYDLVRIDTGPIDAATRVKLWVTNEAAILQELRNLKLDDVADQIDDLLALDKAGDLGDVPISLTSLKWAAALLLRSDSCLGQADVVVDRDGFVGFHFENPEGREGVIVVHDIDEVSFALKAVRPSTGREVRLQGVLGVDSVADKIGEFVTGKYL